MHMGGTQYFHRGLLLTTQRKEKGNQRNTLKYVWIFCFSKESKTRQEKLFTRESSQQAKEEREIFLGFLLILQLNEL